MTHELLDRQPATFNAGIRADGRPVVCQLLHGLPIGGAEVMAAGLARQLRDKYRFLFVCLDQVGVLGEQLRDEGFPVALIDRRPGIDLSCGRRLARVLCEERVCLLHAHQYTPFFYALASRFLRKRPPVLFTEHGRWFPDHPRRKRIIFNRLMLRHDDRVVGVGECVRQALIRNEGMRPARVEVIYNGVATPSSALPPQQRTLVRTELGCADDELLVLQVARLDHLKDHLTALRAMDRLGDRRPRVRLVLAGDGPERDKIEQETRRLGLAQSVTLLGMRRDVPRLLAAADILLLTSISEGVPLTVLEGMATGLPVVSTSVGGVPEIVVSEETGLLAPSGDDQVLANALKRLADDPALRRRMGEKGRDRWRELFDLDSMRDAYDRLYRVMLSD